MLTHRWLLTTVLFAVAGCVAWSLAVTSQAEAAIITSTVPEYNGPYPVTGPFPLAPVTVGTFSYTIPAGEDIVSATISGTFGNSVYPNSSGVDVYANSILVASCPQWPTFLSPCNDASTPTSWSFTFPSSDFSALTSGSVDLTAVQTSQVEIRLGQTTLALTATPEPGTLSLVGPLMGVLALGVRTRRSRAVLRRRGWEND